MPIRVARPHVTLSIAAARGGPLHHTGKVVEPQAEVGSLRVHVVELVDVQLLTWCDREELCREAEIGGRDRVETEDVPIEHRRRCEVVDGEVDVMDRGHWDPPVALETDTAPTV